MTVTNEERREVARRLLELPDDSTYPDLIGAIADHDGWYAAADMADRLADLIEPEPERITRRACYVEKYPPKSEVYFEICSECGCILSATWPGDRHCKTANYCPNCGAEVVDE